MLTPVLLTALAAAAAATALYEPTTRAGEKCAGAPGMPFHNHVPCVAGHHCVDKPSYAPGEWGKFCLPAAAHPHACYPAGARCMGAPGRDYVLWKPCCRRGHVCADDKRRGWGRFCRERGAGEDGYALDEAPPVAETPYHNWRHAGRGKKVVYPDYHWGKHAFADKESPVFAEHHDPVVVVDHHVATTPVTAAPVVTAAISAPAATVATAAPAAPVVTAAPVAAVATAAPVAAVATAAPVAPAATAAPVAPAATAAPVAPAATLAPPPADPAPDTVADPTVDAADDDAGPTDEPAVRVFWGQ